MKLRGEAVQQEATASSKLWRIEEFCAIYKGFEVFTPFFQRLALFGASDWVGVKSMRVTPPVGLLLWSARAVGKLIARYRF
jgi:hypothetical protein